jgi:ferritin-like metal-binding protein YciE
VVTEISDQLTNYLADAHSIEEQALAQLRTAPDIAGDPHLAEAFRTHETETEEAKIAGSFDHAVEAALEAQGVER